MSAIRFRISELTAGWRGVCLVAITYVYFLIFAQFAFLNRLGELGIADAHLRLVMGTMALAGFGFSLLPSLRSFETWPRLRLQLSFVVCGVAAALSLLNLNLPLSIAVAFLIGAGLGTLTVTLVSNLRLWIGEGEGLLKVGLGTGIGYFICNVPSLFTAKPTSQAITAASLCLLGIFAASKVYSPQAAEPMQSTKKQPSFGAVLAGFTALVWLDSAAFFIIQNTPALKVGTWEGALHLWTNGTLHLLAALASAFLLRRRGLSVVFGLAVLALAFACILLHQPGQIVLASLFYPVGVSLYSVALVAYPSLLATSQSLHQRAFRAGLIYAVAGWFGSAMGIGMGQHLRQVPFPFIGLAALLILAPASFVFVRKHLREAVMVGVALAIALCLHLALFASRPVDQLALTPEERGRQVYIAEGCINCHSQYVRPNTPDVLMWGPTETIEELRTQHPPLIGNRRQGPDLSQVGGRRSPLWLKAHFFNPREVSHASFMPSYAYLFDNSTRGDDLVRYLSSLKSPDYAKHIALEQMWHPVEAQISAAHSEDGAHLYGKYCGTCHEATGTTRVTWTSQFKRLPPNLKTGPWLHVPVAASGETRLRCLAQIIKFGIPETDMPGHEYLSDKDVSSIALWLNQTMVLPQQSVTIKNQPGENR
jgi:cbb3-type cytochrome c oxidase subunit II